MYLEYFNLREHPFQLTPDSDFLYMSESHARAKAYMDYTIWNRDGFVVITGEIGAGKTTLIQKLLSEFDDNALVAKIFQTQLDETEFLQAVLVEFGLNPFNARKVELMDMLSTFLIENFTKSKQMVLIVDEAQNLSPRVLEEIRMLSGLETKKEKILHVILVGQPELNQVLDSAEMEQLLQRVRLRCHISALSPEETRDYILHRLQVAGASDKSLFSPDVMSVVYDYTGGIPRLINTLCDMALTCAFTDSSAVVNRKVMSTAIEELQWKPYKERLKQRDSSRCAPTKRSLGLQMLAQESITSLRSIHDRLAALETVTALLTDINKRVATIESAVREVAQQSKKEGRDSSPPQKKKRTV